MDCKGEQMRIPAAFMRGGTSKALIFKEEDLPVAFSERKAIFLSALGSPDPYGRQLDGMGGGISSLSKVCVIGPATHPASDIDYTFYQVGIRDQVVDVTGNCGNMSSAVGPFAVDEGMVSASDDGYVTVRIHNTNTGKLIHSTFPVRNGLATVAGETTIIGVNNKGAAIRLDFLEPGGTIGRGVLPTKAAIDLLELRDGRTFRVSIVDSANACVFIAAGDIGLSALEAPDKLATQSGHLALLEEIRRAASVAMGLATTIAEAGEAKAIPKIAIIGSPGAYRSLDGQQVSANDYAVAVRMLSMEVPHKAIPLTGALCVATAARLKGSVVEQLANSVGEFVKIGTPSGIIEVDTDVVNVGDAEPVVKRATVWRTARRLMDGYVYVNNSFEEIMK